MIKNRLLLVMFLLFISSHVFCLEFPLEYLKFPDEEKTNAYYPVGYQGTMLQTGEKPDGLKLPELFCKTLVYGKVKFNGQDIYLVIDKKSKSDDFYNKVYFDFNNNKDLTDDPVFEGKVQWYSENNCNVTFNQIDTKVKQDGKEIPYCLSVRLYSYGITKGGEVNPKDIYQLNINLTSQSCYKTELSYNDKKYNVFISDRNVNASYTDKLSINENVQSGRMVQELYLEGERFYISEKQPSYYDGFVLCDLIYLDNTLFTMSVDIPNKKLTLTPKENADCTLKYPDFGIQKVQFISKIDNVKNGIIVVSTERALKVPAGEYMVASYEAKKEESAGSGVFWTVQAAATTGTKYVPVEKGKEAELVFGEPFIVKADLPDWAKQNIKFSSAPPPAQLEMGVLGAGNEIVTRLECDKQKDSKLKLSTKYPNRPAEAKFVIVRDDGKIEKEGKFEYG